MARWIRGIFVVAIAGLPSGGGRAQECDRAYPGVCIPPPPPDLDCTEIAEHDFEVRAPDPHGFDRDHDGIGCETTAR
jgi:micrococcal nuclease